MNSLSDKQRRHQLIHEDFNNHIPSVNPILSAFLIATEDLSSSEDEKTSSPQPDPILEKVTQQLSLPKGNWKRCGMCKRMVRSIQEEAFSWYDCPICHYGCYEVQETDENNLLWKTKITVNDEQWLTAESSTEIDMQCGYEAQSESSDMETESTDSFFLPSTPSETTETDTDDYSDYAAAEQTQPTPSTLNSLYHLGCACEDYSILENVQFCSWCGLLQQDCDC